MRTFTLFDTDGAEYSLTASGTAFFHTIDGLGFERSMDFQQVDEQFWLLQNKVVQNVVSGTVYFWKDDCESQYFTFAKFCRNEPLKIKYNPGHGEYYRNGYVKTIKRGDGSGNPRSATIQFVCTTPWYKVVQKYNDGTASDGKIYDYTYDFTYTDAVPGSLIYDNDSFHDCPTKLIINGPATNPVWRHYVDGDLVATGAVTGTIASGYKLIIDTTTMPWSIKQYNSLGTLVSDMYQLSDFSTERFIRLAHGQNVISVTDDGSDVVTLALEARIEYDTI